MPTRAQIVGRIAAGLLGGWGFVWGFTALTITALVAFGQPYGEAVMAAKLLAFLVFLFVFCGAFAAASLSRVWAVLAGGAALMSGAAWWLQRMLV